MSALRTAIAASFFVVAERIALSAVLTYVKIEPLNALTSAVWAFITCVIRVSVALLKASKLREIASTLFATTSVIVVSTLPLNVLT